MNLEIPDVQAGIRKVRGTRDQIANSCWIIGKEREFWAERGASTFSSLIMLKPLTMQITAN